MRKSILDDDIERVLLTGDQIDEIVKRLAAQIDEDYKGRPTKLLLLCILKGSVIFMGDLMKALATPTEIDFMKVSSYGSGTESSGRVNIILDLHRKDLADCDILVVEDIIDSGRTLSYLTEYLAINGAHSVRTCTLLDKPERRTVEFVPDYVGAKVPDEFVVGYGLDYDEKYRSLPYVGILKRSIYQKPDGDSRKELK